ncbi:MAG: hypothetical protein ACLFT1_09175 [Desulfonatronovibrio sp.]
MSEKREALIQGIKAKIDEWNAEIDRLQAKADQAEAKARIDYQEEIQGLEQIRDDARQKLQKLEQAGEGAWEDLRSGFEIAFEAMDEALRSARQRFK